MNTFLKTIVSSIFLGILLLFSSCSIHIDEVNPSGYEVERDILVRNFESINMGNAFKVRIRAGNGFSVIARGDERDLDELDVYVRNGTLYAKYNNYRSRRYLVTFDIVMPDLRYVDFSGASTSQITGFDLRNLDINLSGASKCDIDADAQFFNFDLSGASTLNMIGDSQKISGEISGASTLNAFPFRSEEMLLYISGASKARVMVSKFLKVEASGASGVYFRGNPVIEKRISGGSFVERD